MASQLSRIEHDDACAAVGFLTGVPKESVKGYAVLALLDDDQWKITANCTTKAATVALISDALAVLASDLASDLDGVLRS